MVPNATDLVLANNETVNQVIRHFNTSLSTSNLTHHYVSEKYNYVYYVIGALIILSNLIVVISSGLILKKGQQPKSTYLLLGNVSLADTIIGFQLITATLLDNNVTSNLLCFVRVCMLVCPATVSIFSVTFIAVDRYFYILHGLYYQRYFNTTKIRIGILFIWIVGITLGFMPVTGWVNQEFHYTRCHYLRVFPDSLILLISVLSIVPLVLVAMLYSRILVKALANLNRIKGIKKSFKISHSEKPKLRIFRGNGNANKVEDSHSVKCPPRSIVNTNKLNRSNNHHENNSNKNSIESKSINDLVHKDYQTTELDKTNTSELSIYTIDSSDPNYSSSDVSGKPNVNGTHNHNKKGKSKDLKKWRAITIVMLTSGSFIVAWLPLLIVIILYVFCQEKLTNPKCKQFLYLQRGPFKVTAIINSFLNPLIYAWWHKGFQRSVKAFYRKCKQKRFNTDT